MKDFLLLFCYEIPFNSRHMFLLSDSIMYKYIVLNCFQMSVYIVVIIENTSFIDAFDSG